MKVLLAGICLLVTLPLFAHAGTAEPITPTAKDRCPVCGMFTARFPEFLSQIIFTDGTYVTFDGSKDMFKYYIKLGKRDPDKMKAGINAIYTKDYYSLENIDAREAYFVIGSDVFGPMGKEAIPFTDLEAAKEFQKDHKGKEIIRFDEITAELLKKLE